MPGYNIKYTDLVPLLFQEKMNQTTKKPHLGETYWKAEMRQDRSLQGFWLISMQNKKVSMKDI